MRDAFYQFDSCTSAVNYRSDAPRGTDALLAARRASLAARLCAILAGSLPQSIEDNLSDECATHTRKAESLFLPARRRPSVILHFQRLSHSFDSMEEAPVAGFEHQRASHYDAIAIAGVRVEFTAEISSNSDPSQERNKAPTCGQTRGKS